MRSPAAAAVLLVLVLAVAGACGGSGEAADPPPPEATGLVTEVREDDGEVSSFTLESLSGTFEVRIAEDVDYGFDLRHLHEHERDRQPVRCRLEQRDDGNVYALRIDDA